MRILNLKRKTIPKVAVLVTGLAAAVLVGVSNSQPAQASPTYASACVPCHTAGGSVTATPSSATVAPGASYTVALAFTGGTSPVGYWISGNGASVTASNAGPANMTAPAAAGTYTYTVWMRSGVAAKVDYTITVGAAATTTAPATTAPATTAPATTAPATTAPATTAPATTAPATTAPATTVPPANGNPYTPTGAIGAGHLSMYKLYASKSCASCHNGTSQPKPPTLKNPDADMKKASCASCHADGGKLKRAPLFISQMTSKKGAGITYSRCSNCHKIAAAGK